MLNVDTIRAMFRPCISHTFKFISIRFYFYYFPFNNYDRTKAHDRTSNKRAEEICRRPCNAIKVNEKKSDTKSNIDNVEHIESSGVPWL